MKCHSINLRGIFLLTCVLFVPELVNLNMHNGIQILDTDKPTVGAKLKFQCPQELQDAVDDYFNEEEKITLPGLALLNAHGPIIVFRLVLLQISPAFTPTNTLSIPLIRPAPAL